MDRYAFWVAILEILWTPLRSLLINIKMDSLVNKDNKLDKKKNNLNKNKYFIKQVFTCH